MKRATLFSKLFLATALSAGALAIAVPSQAAPECKKDKTAPCPRIYSPVICDGGKIYSNDCLAQADCATGCVPYQEPVQ